MMKTPFIVRLLLMVVSANWLMACSFKSQPEQQVSFKATLEMPAAPTPEMLISQTVKSTAEPLLTLRLANSEERQGLPTSILWTTTDQIVVSDQEGVALLNIPAPDATLPQADVSPQVVAPSINPLFLSGDQQGEWIAWVTDQTSIQLWNSTDGSAPIPLTILDSPVTGLSLNSNRNQIAVSTFQGTVMLLDPTTQQTIQQWSAPAWLSNLSYSPDGELLGGADLTDFSVYIFSLDGQLKQHLEWDQSIHPALYGAFFSPDWKKIAWAAGSVVQVMEIRGGELTPIFGHQDAISAFAWSPDNRFIATSAVNASGAENISQIYLWDLTLPGLARTLELQSAVQSLSFSPDGRRLGILNVNGQLQIYDFLP